MTGKRCFKCGIEKPLYQFYPHSQMADGTLGKCKECTKKDTWLRVERKKLEPAWRDQERMRCRLKQDRFRRERSPEQIERDRVSLDKARVKWLAKNPEKRKAQHAANNALRDGKIPRKYLCEMCGSTGPLQKHHHDYSKPLDVIWVCKPCHGKSHRKTAEQPMQRAA
jgi:hypothetical protein